MSATVTAMSQRTSAERITVGLTRRVSEELTDLAEQTGMSKTDLVNRAVSLYRLTMAKADEGQQLAFVDHDRSSVEIVHIL